MFMKSKLCLLAVFVAAAAIGRAQTNFTITTPGSQFAFVVNGTNDNPSSPTLNLPAGATYMFVMNTAGFHPVGFLNTNSTIPVPASAYYSGDAVKSSTSSGTNFVTIPATGYPTNLWYECTVHGFSGLINVTPPLTQPAPPSNNIVSITLTSTNVTITSTGTTTTYTLIPQYNSNLVSGVWLDVPGFTNTFAAGTNTTVFDRLEPICGPDVFLRISQRAP
jgi:hypothetical protein